VDDATLLARCAEGDPLAWEALVRRHQSRVYAVAYHYLRDAEEARDQAQEIFIRVYERLHTFRGEERFLPWMLRLARNACIDRLRRRAARPPGADLRIEDDLEVAVEAPDAEALFEAESRRRLLYRALDRMSEKHREMILLKEIQGLQLEELASLLGLPLGTVKSRSSRARLELAETLLGLDPSYGRVGA
jgi:RNA polymerase sigma-70 factor (ECF subfamily)